MELNKSTNEGRILIIDDEWSIRDILSTVLTAEGYEVETAENGAVGLKMIPNGNYDLIITDLNMPEVGGLEVLRYMTSHSPASLGIVATGYGSMETTISALKAGAFDYITKPFHLDEIKLLIRRAREYQKLRAENHKLRELATPVHAANGYGAPAQPPIPIEQALDFNALVDEYERALIGHALQKANGVKNRAAELLRIKRTTLVEKMKKKGITVRYHGAVDQSGSSV